MTKEKISATEKVDDTEKTKTVKAREGYTIKYTGVNEISVPSIVGESAHFTRNKQNTYEDPRNIEVAKKLVEQYDHFKEVE